MIFDPHHVQHLSHHEVHQVINRLRLDQELLALLDMDAVVVVLDSRADVGRLLATARSASLSRPDLIVVFCRAIEIQSSRVKSTNSVGIWLGPNGIWAWVASGRLSTWTSAYSISIDWAI